MKPLLRLGAGVRDILEHEVSQGPLGELSLDFLYAPVVFPKKHHDRFTERTRFLPAEDRFECCPRLDWDVFAGTCASDQLTELLRGLRDTIPNLREVRASEEQVRHFATLINTTEARLLLTLNGS